MSDHDDDEPPGYGNPPKNHQFKPGQSGNPKGRPKGVARTTDDIIARALGRAVSRVGQDGEEQVSVIEAVLDNAMLTAAKGDRYARRDVLRLLQRSSYVMSMAANDNDGRDDEIARLKALDENQREQLRKAGQLADEILLLAEDKDCDLQELAECVYRNYRFLEELAGFACEPSDEEDGTEG